MAYHKILCCSLICVIMFFLIRTTEYGLKCRRIMHSNGIQQLDVALDNGCVIGFAAASNYLTNAPPETVCRLLEHACTLRGGELHIIEIILHDHSDIHMCDTTLFHPLHRCAENGCAVCCKVLISHGANPFFLVNGATPLQVVSHHSVETAKIIMKSQDEKINT